MKSPMSRMFQALFGLAGALLLVAPARGQQRNEFGEPNQTVARISYLSGDVSFSRGDDPNDWQPADRNVSMTLGDRVYTGNRSRLELQVHGGDVIRLGARTDLAALNLTDDTKQFSVKVGVASFRIRRLSDYETFEVDTPNAAVTFERPGEYRVDVDSDGNTRIGVRDGSASVAAGGGQLSVQAGEMIELEGLDSPRYDIFRLPGADGWDQWVGQRESRFAHARSYQYVSADIVGVDDLDDYGRWQRVPQYGFVWSPNSVDPDWVPYRAGHWIWQDPWGWSWVSSEPWGWAPYHYGRWVSISSRWCWIPVAPTVRYVDYSPALVAFVGGGPGWSLSVSAGGGGFIGWFPLAPRDPFVPWWGSRAGVRTTTVTNVTYVNQTYVTVVNRSTFISGGVVTGAVVRDRAVVTQAASAPVFSGPVPAIPTAGAIRVAVRTEGAAAPRPPAAIVERAVVARVAPPPAPPTFQAKLALITQNHGAPVAPAAAARISVENRGRPQSVIEVKPVAQESGRMVLAPRSAQTGSEARRPEPVAPARGRPMATAQQPVATSPVTAATAPSGSPGRQVAPRERVAPAAPSPQAQPESSRQGGPPPDRAMPQGERGRPQSEDWRQRVQPTQPPPPGLERRREAGQPQQPAQPAPERRPEMGQPPQQPAQPPPGAERQRVRPTPSPEAVQERRREAGPPPQQAQPPQQQAPPRGQERRIERPTPPPEAAPERRRDTGPPPQQQQPPPQGAPERGRQGGPPPQQQQTPPQGDNRPQVERGRGKPQQPEDQKKGKDQEKKDEKKPTPTS